MKTIIETQNELKTQQQNNAVLSQVTTPSKVGVLGNLIYIISFAVFTLRQLFENFKLDVQAIADAKEPHRETWYEQQAMAFQFGYDLPEGKTEYDNSNLTTAEIEASQIVAFAVAVQERDKSTLFIKIANKDKQPLTDINEVADVGVHITVINQVADAIKLTLNVEYKATLLNTKGVSLADDSRPIEEAINLYLSNLNFNEQYVSMRLIDALQKLPSVVIAEVEEACYKYDVLEWQIIHRKYTPKAGYMSVVPDNLTINYIKYS